MSPKLRGLSPKSMGRGELFLLAGLVACLSGVVGLSPAGVIGFMQSVGQIDLFSVSILASLIAVVIVLLYRFGFSIAYVEEIEPQRL